MGDIKLFRLASDGAIELEGRSVAVERTLQERMERHLDAFLGVSLLASEYSTGKTHGVRIDMLGIDENRCPVIIEYKRASNQAVINQGLFYLDWLLDHQAEFQLLVMKQLGVDIAERIEWSGPRLICIAGDFTKYDIHAVQQINRNIELMRYRRYDDDLLLLELVNAVTATSSASEKATPRSSSERTATEQLEIADSTTTDLFQATKEFLEGLGDDVQMRTLKLYFAFRRIKNFACIEIVPGKRSLRVFVKVDPGSIQLVDCLRGVVTMADAA